jgi:hypothetical protein
MHCEDQEKITRATMSKFCRQRSTRNSKRRDANLLQRIPLESADTGEMTIHRLFFNYEMYRQRRASPEFIVQSSAGSCRSTCKNSMQIGDHALCNIQNRTIPAVQHTQLQNQNCLLRTFRALEFFSCLQQFQVLQYKVAAQAIEVPGLKSEGAERLPYQGTSSQLSPDACVSLPPYCSLRILRHMTTT